MDQQQGVNNMQEITTLKELKQAIKKARAVYVSTTISKHDETYVQVVKADILFQIRKWNDVELSYCRFDDDNDLFIS